MSKFQQGDIIKIRSDFDPDNAKGPSWNPSMDTYIGKDLTYDRPKESRTDWFRIKEDTGAWTWFEEWFELADRSGLPPTPKAYE